MTTTDAHWGTLHEAVSILAGACDYAYERDGAGFSSADAGIGHFIAEVPLTEWILEYVLTSQKLVRKYRRQLTGHPALDLINHKFIPATDTMTDEDIEAVYIGAREVARRGGEIHRARTRIAAGSSVHVDGTTVALSFPYDEELIEESRAIPGRSYDRETKANHYPLTSLSAVIVFADRHGIRVDDETRTLATAVDANPRAYADPNVTVDGKAFKIVCPFVDGLAPALRTLNGNKATWDGPSRSHRLSLTCDRGAFAALLRKFDLVADDDVVTLLGLAPVEPHVTLDGSALLIAATSGINDAVYDLRGSNRVTTVNGALRIGTHVAPAELLAHFTTAGLRLGDGVAEALTNEIDTQARNRASATAETGTAVAVPGLGVDLFPHQHPAVQHIVDRRRLILADDMGLGKTITALASVAAADSFPVVIACKPDLISNWHKESARALPGRKIYTAAGMTARDIPADAEIVIIGFTALAALAERRTRTAADRYTWVEKIVEFGPQAFIVDEGHLGKNETAARSQAMAKIGPAVAAVDGLVLDLTGTPLVNRPRELAQQLVMLGYLAEEGETATDAHLFGEFGGFLYRYCGPVKNDHGTTFKGHSNLAELHDRLKAWGLYIRRDESALDLPPFAIRMLELDPALLDPDVMEEYREAEANVLAYILGSIQKEAKARGAEPTAEMARAAISAQKAVHLVKQNHLRQILGRAKLPAVKALVAEQVSAGEKVMIAAHHADVVGEYADSFGGLTIRGGQSAAEKDADKFAFQTAPLADAPVITVSIGAGGVGHTLTAARIGVQAELCWTPGELKQMAKRIHRIGQDRPVDFIVPVVPNSNDMLMWAMLGGKQLVLDAVIDGVELSEDRDEEDGAVAIAMAMAQTALANA
ncbi:DEAD/DEAH box helicase [Rhodococcus qingshengii]|uniref:DEAD/DEAH box helicase n=1 Tax=Rhodococcus qingshengii TaxID=334542 RepID=A0AAW6LPZ4_RHOSG|nr:DEAD/DEAH box helicase [Rhodococcus qingshengii]MDE8647551.1 DEAD/DEAH box helicase [Rhodococcus qingshengii]